MPTNVTIFDREVSPEIATSTALYARVRDAFRKNQKPDPPLVSYLQLVDIMSYTIAEDPIHGHTIDKIMDILGTQGLVSEDDYPEILLRGCIPATMTRFVISGYTKFDPMQPSFVDRLLREILTNGPVVAVFPICTDYNVDRASTLYLAEGDVATNEEDHNAILALAVILTGCSVIDGIPYWIFYSHYTRCRDERGRGRVELDALFTAYAPVIPN